MKKEYAPIWNIGLRPFASQNADMYNIVRKHQPQDAKVIKQEYIDRALSISNSFKVNGNMDEDDAAHLWILRKG